MAAKRAADQHDEIRLEPITDKSEVAKYRQRLARGEPLVQDGDKYNVAYVPGSVNPFQKVPKAVDDVMGRSKRSVTLDRPLLKDAVGISPKRGLVLQGVPRLDAPAGAASGAGRAGATGAASTPGSGSTTGGGGGRGGASTAGGD